MSGTDLGVFTIWAGHALQTISPKRMLALALTCFTVGGTLGLGVGDPVAFVAGYSVLALGLGAGLSTAACIAFVSRVYPSMRGMLGGTLLALYGMSSVISAPLFASLDDRFGWRAALAALMGVYALVGWAAWITLPGVTGVDQAKRSAPSILALLSRRPVQWALGLLVLATPLGSASFATIGNLVGTFGFSPPSAVTAVALMAASNGLGRLGFGALADWRGARFSRIAVLSINAVAAIGLLAVFHGADRHLLLVYAVLMGLSFGGMAGKLPTLAAHVVKDGHAESAFGLLFGAFALASFLGPLLSAAVGMHAALEVLAVMAITSAVFVHFTPCASLHRCARTLFG